VITPELARRLGIEIAETKLAAGAGGQVEIGLARIACCAVGEASRRDLPIIVSSEVERIGAAVGSTLNGVIGYEFLRHFRLTVDYNRLVLSLDDGPSATREVGVAALAELPIRLAHSAKPLIVVPTSVNGTGPYTFAVDTGASVSVISSDLAARLGIRTEAVVPMTGGGGAIRTSAGRARSVAIANAEVTNFPVAVAGFLESISQVIGTELSGIVGFNYLREFLVTIDYIGGTLRLEEPSTTP
jgi:predicted aspartyl protease